MDTGDALSEVRSKAEETVNRLKNKNWDRLCFVRGWGRGNNWRCAQRDEAAENRTNPSLCTDKGSITQRMHECLALWTLPTVSRSLLFRAFSYSNYVFNFPTIAHVQLNNVSFTKCLLRVSALTAQSWGRTRITFQNNLQSAYCKLVTMVELQSISYICGVFTKLFTITNTGNVRIT